jgi:hypothetical protein
MGAGGFTLSGFGSMSVYSGSVPEHHTKLSGMGFIRLLPFHLSLILIASLPFTDCKQHLSLLDVSYLKVIRTRVKHKCHVPQDIFWRRKTVYNIISDDGRTVRCFKRSVASYTLNDLQTKQRSIPKVWAKGLCIWALHKYEFTYVYTNKWYGKIN